MSRLILTIIVAMLVGGDIAIMVANPLAVGLANWALLSVGIATITYNSLQILNKMDVL